MNTTLRRRLDALESKLGTAEETVELLGCRLTMSRLKDIFRRASGTSIGVATDESRAATPLLNTDPGRNHDG